MHSRTWCCRATKMKPGAPGPPLRYLYPQPTAKSTWHLVSWMGRAPALWARSQITNAPLHAHSTHVTQECWPNIHSQLIMRDTLHARTHGNATEQPVMAACR